MIRVHVDANLSCGSGYEEDRRYRRRLGTAEQANSVEPCLNALNALAFPHSARTHQEFGFCRRNIRRLLRSCRDLSVDQFLHFHGVLASIAVDNNAPRHRPQTQLNRTLRHLAEQILRIVQQVQPKALSCVQALSDHFLFSISRSQAKGGPAAAQGRTPGGRKRHQANRGRCCIGIGVPTHRPERTVPTFFNVPQQCLEWWTQACLVQDKERVRPHEAGLVRSHSLRNAVALEQQPRTHHVHRADDNGGLGRIIQPSAIVSLATPKR